MTICIKEGCLKRSTFNLPTEKKALYCFEHKKENMIDVINKRCIKDGCNKIPNFNLQTETKGLYCFEHKKENMINIKSKRCIEKFCSKIPNFNLPTETKGLYCSEHKKENMIDVISKRCIKEGCLKRPSFNLPTETKALYCSEHKKENMIDVISKKCQKEGCVKQSAFNLPTEKKGLYCFEHKKENMINIKNKKCQNSICKNDAMFGFKNKKAQYCSYHKKENMINIILENKCSIPECEDEYMHIVDNIKYCLTHIPDNKAEIVLKRLCKYCDIEEESKYVCKDCQKIQHKKEWAIVRYLRKIIDTPFEYDSSKMLQGCSKKRPDIYFELNKHCVIVEVDEHQHREYEDSCECARINEIVNGIGGKSVIIIRYNPDTIKNNGKKINIKQHERLELLIKTIKKELTKDYDEFIVKIIQLYYDDDYEIYKPLKRENITDIVCI